LYLIFFEHRLEFFIFGYKIKRNKTSLIYQYLRDRRNFVADINKLCTSGKKITTQRIENENGLLNLV